MRTSSNRDKNKDHKELPVTPPESGGVKGTNPKIVECSDRPIKETDN